MKFILFSDVHCDVQACERIVEAARHVDFAIGAGDFGLFREGLDKTFAALSGIRVPTIVVPGNHESHAELLEACDGLDHFHVLHGNSVRVNDLMFHGLGGGVPVTSFGPWSVDHSEEQAAALLPKDDQDRVLVTHSPPFGCLDKLSGGGHVGSQAVRACVDETRPLFVVCGHIHEHGGKLGEIDGIPVINAGPRGVEFEYPG